MLTQFEAEYAEELIEATERYMETGLSVSLASAALNLIYEVYKENESLGHRWAEDSALAALDAFKKSISCVDNKLRTEFECIRLERQNSRLEGFKGWHRSVCTMLSVLERQIREGKRDDTQLTISSLISCQYDEVD